MPTRTTSTPAWVTGGRPTTAPTTPGSPRSRPPTTRTACSTSPRRCEPAQQTGPQPELRARSNLSAWLRAGVVVRLADELRITERVELVRPVLRVLAEGVPGGHVAEQDEAGAARVVDTPVRVEMAWPRRRHGTAAQGAGTVRLGAAGDLAQREVGLEVELGVLLAVRRGEQFQETPWVYVRRTAGGPFRPVRGPVEVEVAVLEHVVQAARQPVRRRRRAYPVEARVGGALEIAQRITGLGRVAVCLGSCLVWPRARVEYRAAVALGNGRVGDRVAERRAGLPVTGLELGADVDLVRAPGVDVADLGRVELRLEVERCARAVVDVGALEAVGGRGLHEAALMRREVVNDHFEGVTTSRRGRVEHVDVH